MKKSLEELKKLNTRNLLFFYKAERNRMFKKGYRYQIVDDDEYGNPAMGWTDSQRSETFGKDIDFLISVRNELSTRDNVT